MTTPADPSADPSAKVTGGGKRLGRPLGDPHPTPATPLPVTPPPPRPRRSSRAKSPPWLLWVALAGTVGLLLSVLFAAQMPRFALTLPAPATQARPTPRTSVTPQQAAGLGVPMNQLPPQQLRLDMVDFVSGGRSPVLHLRDGTTLSLSSLSPAQVNQLPGDLRERLEYSRARR